MKSRTRITASPAGALCSFLVSLLYAPLLHAAQDWQFALLASGVILHFSLLYLLASRWRYTAAGEFVKGAYIGLNAAWNMMLLHLLTGSWSLGSIAAVIVLLSSFLHISRHSAYHTLLGWTNWLLPMSWPVNLPGLLGLIANLCLAPLSHKRGWGHWRMRLFFHG
ncbi:MAG: hypothetical protein EAZ89_03895, partial [Bacteroidetes bacterium]